jgi:glycerophosphoryl diester phosphodiesterase
MSGGDWPQPVRRAVRQGLHGTVAIAHLRVIMHGPQGRGTVVSRTGGVEQGLDAYGCSMTESPLVIAHRGASGYRPEHTTEAYELAIELGADAVEPDVVATKDGVLVVRHENELSGTTDVASHPEFATRRPTKIVDGLRLTGWFTEDFVWDELRTLRAVERLPRIRMRNAEFAAVSEPHILRLDDVIALVAAADRAVGLVAELKHATYFGSIGLPLSELLYDRLAASGWLDDPRLTVESFELGVLRELRGRGILAPLVFLVDSAGAPADEVALRGGSSMPYREYLTLPHLARLADTVDGISVDKRLLTKTDGAGNLVRANNLVDRAHAAGLTAFCWTLRAENEFLAPNLRLARSVDGFGDWMAEFQLLMRTGIDAVFADQPDLALRARAAL